MVAGYLALQGCEVFLPLKGQSRCDLIYLRDGVAVRVQVKTASRTRTGRFVYEQCRLVSDRRRHNKPTTYTETDVDEIWIVGTHLWCFPISAVEGLTSVCLTSSNPAPRADAKSYDPERYVLVRGSFDHPYRERLHQ